LSTGRSHSWRSPEPGARDERRGKAFRSSLLTLYEGSQPFLVSAERLLRPVLRCRQFAGQNDRTLFLFIFSGGSEPEAHGAAAQKAILHKTFAGGSWELPRILSALDSCNDLYFDRVSQIRMDAWSRGRIALVGDAGFCVSLRVGRRHRQSRALAGKTCRRRKAPARQSCRCWARYGAVQTDARKAQRNRSDDHDLIHGCRKSCRRDRDGPGTAARLRLRPHSLKLERQVHRRGAAADAAMQSAPARADPNAMLRFCRPQSATPVFVIPDEIVPGAARLKDLPDPIDAARKKTRGASCLVWSSR
jgi:hypothetical protein